jgi:transposase
MAREPSEITDVQWAKIAPLLPVLQAAPCGGQHRLFDTMLSDDNDRTMKSRRNRTAKITAAQCRNSFR